MSLKVFHIIFIVMTIVLAAVCAVWSFNNQTPPVIGYCAIVAGLGMLAYGIWFLRKARNIIT